MPWHAVFAFLNPLLIGVIQVKCQGASSSPFLTNPTEMWTFLLATLVYCFAFAANIKWRRRRTIYALFPGHMALIFGSLSSISLFSIILPTMWGQLIFSLWIFLPVLVLRQFLYWPFQWTLKVVSRLVSNIRKRFNIDGNLDERPQAVIVLV
ncbi:hypothetical protein TIFTF001_019600 [Ficus carica]|uniref:Uncharacterized protein n=1 Tax=Ficus carica TaxID=3494 RepID=A0AA88AX29_FICCA|nr:hypothetical protein TIFTF001_019600 [Ficus carica]